MANRLAHHRRAAVAALLLCFVVATMLVTISGIGVEHDQRAVDGGDVVPVGAGVTHTASTAAEWDAAIAAAAPGDVIRLTATINSRLVYRGDNDGGTATGAAGTAAAPIVITADPGVWIDPGNQNSGFGALDILHVDHVHAVGVNVRNAQFGIRCMQCNGAAGAPVRIANSTVTAIGHAGINIAGHWSTHAPSSHVVVENNVVSNTGMTAAAFGEGVYLGHGSTEWVDVTSDVVVSGNDISNTGAEGVDVKPGTRNITVTGNYIHDLAPISGGAISAHYVNATPNPHPAQLDQVTITGNKIWNVNLAGVAGSNDWAIWVGHGGVDVIGNTIWGLRNNPSSARAIRVRATQDFGPHPINISNNVFWSAQGWLAEGSPSGAANVSATGNRGVATGSSEILVDETDFTGPIPALGVSGTADAGGGPGSGFALVGGGGTTTTTATTAPPPTSATTAAPTTPAPPPTTATTAPPTTATTPTTTPSTAATGAPETTVPSDDETTIASTTTTGAGQPDPALTTTTVFWVPAELGPASSADAATLPVPKAADDRELAFEPRPGVDGTGPTSTPTERSALPPQPDDGEQEIQRPGGRPTPRHDAAAVAAKATEVALGGADGPADDGSPAGDRDRLPFDAGLVTAGGLVLAGIGSWTLRVRRSH